MKRFVLAASLTALAIAVAENFVGVIWQAWSGVLWIRAVILLLLGVWVASETVVWILVYYDSRQEALNERRLALSLGPSSMAGESGRDSDV